MSLPDRRATITQNAPVYDIGPVSTGAGASFFWRSLRGLDIEVNVLSIGKVTLTESYQIRKCFGLSATSSPINMRTSAINNSGLIGRAAKPLAERGAYIDCQSGWGAC